MDETYWKIGDFASLIDRHVNTVDKWFKMMEEQKVHYVERVNGEKVYSELDLNIAQFIKERRKDKWVLTAIYEVLPDYHEVRPFPIEDHESNAQSNDLAMIKEDLYDELKKSFQEIAATQMQDMKQWFHETVPSLPSQDEQRANRFDTIMTRRKVERRLEERALSKWAEKPVEERIKRIGWFRKAEDHGKRERFVKQYIDKHFEEELKKEFDIEERDS